MQSNYTETEVKLHVPDLSAVEKRLQALNAVLAAPRVFERNVRYENAANDLSANGVVLRLRQDNRARLTYKDPATKRDINGINSRFEAEVEVSDFDAMATILSKLGFVSYMVYEKYRTTYELASAEIVLDELPYGNFVEIEGEAATIKQLIGQLELDNAPRYGTSYSGLFDRVRQYLRLQFADLTFKNFEGIVVPTIAFATTDIQDKS